MSLTVNKSITIYYNDNHPLHIYRADIKVPLSFEKKEQQQQQQNTNEYIHR